MSGVLCAYLLVLLSVPTSPSLASGLGLNPAALPHLLSNSSASQQLLSAMQPQQLLQAAQAAQAQAAQAVQAVQASQQPLLTTSPQQHSHRHTSHMNHYTVCMTDFWKALSLRRQTMCINIISLRNVTQETKFKHFSFIISFVFSYIVTKTVCIYFTF